MNQVKDNHTHRGEMSEEEEEEEGGNTPFSLGAAGVGGGRREHAVSIVVLFLQKLPPLHLNKAAM